MMVIWMDARVRKIYENAREHMRNSPGDWEKVIRCFEKIHTKELDADIQTAIRMLEDYCRKENK